MGKGSKVLFSITGLILVLIIFGYMYISNGEKIKDRDITWLTKHPIAHRGLHNNIYPENSMGAFKNALNNGYPIELDVRFTKDKQVVVFHDENLGRITKDKRDVSELTYEELSKINLLDSDEKIPLFKDVLQLVNGSVPIVIEIKNCEDIIRLGEETYKLTKNYNGDYSVQSFNPFVIEWYKNNASEVIRGQLSGTMREGAENLKLYEKFALRNLMLNFKSKPNYIAYEVEGLPEFRVTILRKQGIPTIGWTVRNESEEREAYKYCDNIIIENFMAK